MQRIINEANQAVDDMLRGFIRCHEDILLMAQNKRVICSKSIKRGKVGVVSGGGSGHKPAFIGYVGQGLLDVVAVGEVFSSPTAKSFYDSFKAADCGKGVACLYGNYSGDNMNVRMAVKMAQKEGINIRTVVANDDVASAPPEQREKRRGVAGEIFMWKIGGAMAAAGGNLDEVITAAQKAIDNCRSVGIGLSPCTLPAANHPNFIINPGTMELGIGHHGEPGVAVVTLESSQQIASNLLKLIMDDHIYGACDETAVLISGLGATPLMELYILYNDVAKLLAGKGIKIYRAFVGNYFTSLNMMGATLTLMKLDSELKSLLDAECESVGWTQLSRRDC